MFLFLIINTKLRYLLNMKKINKISRLTAEISMGHLIHKSPPKSGGVKGGGVNGEWGEIKLLVQWFGQVVARMQWGKGVSSKKKRENAAKYKG